MEPLQRTPSHWTAYFAFWYAFWSRYLCKKAVNILVWSYLSVLRTEATPWLTFKPCYQLHASICSISAVTMSAISPVHANQYHRHPSAADFQSPCIISSSNTTQYSVYTIPSLRKINRWHQSAFPNMPTYLMQTSVCERTFRQVYSWEF